MNKQPYSWQQRVQGGVRWDREKLSEPNLHVYGKDDTKIMVYNMRRWLKKGDKKTQRKKKIKKQVTKRRTPDS